MSNDYIRLKNHVAERNALIFLGSDLSQYVTRNPHTCCDLKYLLKNGLYRLGQESDSEKAQLAELITKFEANVTEVGDYYSAAAKIKQFYGDREFSSWLEQSLDYDLPLSDTWLRIIEQFKCPILTSTYDTLFSRVLNRKILTWDRSSNQSIVVSSKYLNEHILHVFGCYSESKRIIFTQEDYDQLISNESLQAKLDALIETKAIILIGYDNLLTSPTFLNLLRWIATIRDPSSSPIFVLTTIGRNRKQRELLGSSFMLDIRFIEYGQHPGDLLMLLQNLLSYTTIMSRYFSTSTSNEFIRQKYLKLLIKEYGSVSIFGNSCSNINLPLESVYVELKFDPTHPSIKAMKMLEIDDELRRKIMTPGFFTQEEMAKLQTSCLQKMETNSMGLDHKCMFDQYLSVILGNRVIFSENEANAILRKIQRLKQTVIRENKLEETRQYRLQQAFSEFKHMVVLGHPGSGKTTLSKWLATNMAKQCLDEQNMLFDGTCFLKPKLPILIPIWKYFHVQRMLENAHPKSLLTFICENSLNDMTEFTEEERKHLTWLINENLLRGNVLVIFEGLDEVPAQSDRSNLMKEVNCLLERNLEFDPSSTKLFFSPYECKEVNNKKDVDDGNRFIITSRIEGNYFEELNFYVPRLTIEDMSIEALKLFCDAYIKCLNGSTSSTEQVQSELKSSQLLYDEIIKNQEILQLAINPQLASVIAAVYCQYQGKLPKTRIELYEKSIGTMVERLLLYQDYFMSDKTVDKQNRIDATLIWTVLQEIAHYLHSKVEGLSELALRQMIEKCLKSLDGSVSIENNHDENSTIAKLVDLFKYQAGVLNEFGHDSYRFIHRTFQEFLSAKSMLYENAREITDDQIFKNIRDKIGIPNWRVPLSMTFGMLSKSFRNGESFDNVLAQLLDSDQLETESSSTTSLVPFVIIDSVGDIIFSNVEKEREFIHKLADLLLLDYRNRIGFARLKDHQQLIHSYFAKLKNKHTDILAQWFLAKLKYANNIASCANIILQLKWYDPIFHRIFLDSLDNDDEFWNYPVDAILRFLAKETKANADTNALKLKHVIQQKLDMIDRIRNEPLLLALITALYGGYTNHHVSETLIEYNEISQFLNLKERQRAPFLMYYKEVWDANDPAYSMAVHLDRVKYEEQWSEKPDFKVDEIYKDSWLTPVILKFLDENESIESLVEELKYLSKQESLELRDRVDVAIGLIAIGDIDSLCQARNEADNTFKVKLRQRLDQLIYGLKDPIARYSTYLPDYLTEIKQSIDQQSSDYGIDFNIYSKIFLKLSLTSGGPPINTRQMACASFRETEKWALYSEYLAYKFTASSPNTDTDNYAKSAINNVLDEAGIDTLIKSMLNINSAIQIYRPVRSYPWPMDKFIFHSNTINDLPIGFINCIQNVHLNLGFIARIITNALTEYGYFSRNPDLIPIAILLNYGVNSEDLDMTTIYETLLPEYASNKDVKSLLLEYSYCITNAYYRARVLYQLAEFYDSKTYELLIESYRTAQDIEDAVLKFQVLEMIYAIACSKESEHIEFINNIIEELQSTHENINDSYNRTIALIRISFYESNERRHMFLTKAIESLMQIGEPGERIELILKLKPILDIYPDIRQKLIDIMVNLDDTMNLDLFNQYFSGILYNIGFIADHERKFGTGKSNESNRITSDHLQIETLFRLFASLHEDKFRLDAELSEKQPWVELLNDEHRMAAIEKILCSALHEEIFLTPATAIIIDTLVEQGKEETIALLFPYIIRPSNEVLPIVYRWFRKEDSTSIKKLAALLLVEGRYLLEKAVDPLVSLLCHENDQIRYRAQRIFQHPDRDVNEPSKRISLLGTRTLIKIFKHVLQGYLPRTYCYLSTFFIDLKWDDPIVFEDFHAAVGRLVGEGSFFQNKKFFDRLYFIHADVWDVLFRKLSTSSSPLYIEQLLNSIMRLSNRDQITEQNWNDVTRILPTTDLHNFKQQRYFNHRDVTVIEMVMENLYSQTDSLDHLHLDMLESKVLSLVTIPVNQVSLLNYAQIKHLSRCNFNASENLNDEVLTLLDRIDVGFLFVENLVNWLMRKMITFNRENDTWDNMMMVDCIISLLSGCAQKEGYIYRKVTSSPRFNKSHYIQLLLTMLNEHLFFPVRGSAFILIAAMEHMDHKIITDSMNILSDENIVKEYSMIAIPLINISPHEFISDLLDSISHESAIKTYEILKVFTQFVINERLDETDKTRIIRYMLNEIGLLKSKKPVNYFYTDVKIPFTTTLEIELYKSWVRIQGLSGKAQYTVEAN